ncbi:MAG: MarR family transcriptional regulator [Candidatus Hydrogenedentes bacterium]|nr:MarR family transcriptional regulator [Candidatus Hydrogenedentota bacterium]
MSLKSELGMRKGFENPAHEALLNIYYTASRTRKKAGEFFRLHNLTDVQYNVLSLLKHQSGENGGLTQVELSHMMLVNRANITTLIDRMEKAKLVIRKPVPDDRRYNIIELTEHGLDMYTKVAGVYKRKISDIMGALNQTELSSLIDILEKLRLNLNQVEVD